MPSGVRSAFGVGRGRDGGVLGGVGHVHAAGVAGDQVDRARRGGAEGGAVGVVAHRVVLGVVPQGGDGVAVVVVHHVRGGAVRAGRVTCRRRRRRSAGSGPSFRCRRPSARRCSCGPGRRSGHHRSSLGRAGAGWRRSGSQSAAARSDRWPSACPGRRRTASRTNWPRRGSCRSNGRTTRSPGRSTTRCWIGVLARDGGGGEVGAAVHAARPRQAAAPHDSHRILLNGIRVLTRLNDGGGG